MPWEHLVSVVSTANEIIARHRAVIQRQQQIKLLNNKEL